MGSAAAGAAFKDTWTLSDLDMAWMGLIADEQPAMYQVLQAAGLTHGKGMQSYLCMMAVRLLEMRRVMFDILRPQVVDLAEASRPGPTKWRAASAHIHPPRS